MGRKIFKNGKIGGNFVLVLLLAVLLLNPAGTSCEKPKSYLPVLLYYQLSKDTYAQTVVSPAKFEKDMKFLRDKGYQALSLKDLNDFLEKRRVLPSNPILITFDDGWVSQDTLARPILQKYRLKAALFPHAGLMGKPARLEWSQLREMLATGSFELGSKGFALDQRSPNISATGGVSFAFDDGWESAYKAAFPILEAKGIEATVFPVVQMMKESKAGYMTLKQLQKLKKAGWEVGSHTLTHRDLTGLNRKELKKEILGSKNSLLESGFSATSLALPLGAYNERVLAEAHRYYDYVRSSDDGFNSFPLTSPLKTKFLANTTSLAEVSSSVEEAKRDKKWLVLLFHQIDHSQQQYATAPELFSQIVDVVQSSGLPTPVLSEAEGRFLILPQRRNGSLEEKTAYQLRLAEDFKKSKERFKTETGLEPEYVAYPYGVWNQDAIASLKQTGFKGAFTGDEGVNRSSENPFLLKRILVTEDTDLKRALSKFER